MRVILGGKYECAVMRGIESINNPNRIRTNHPYYIALNRKTDGSYLERVGTFSAISTNIDVPVADWSDSARDDAGVDGKSIGLHTQIGELNEWDEDVVSFVDLLFRERAFTGDTISHISEFDAGDIQDRSRINLRDLKRTIAKHYLCRLFLQIRTAEKSSDAIVLDEQDLRALSEVSAFVIRTGSHPKFALPDVWPQTILGNEFAEGLLNFAPKDVRSISAIRADPQIAEYAKEVRKLLSAPSTMEGERRLLSAMRKTYEITKGEKRAKSVFEFVSWVAKPLHYVPILGNTLSAAEDIKDIIQKGLEIDATSRSWHLLTTRAQEVNIEEYMNRKANL